MSFNISHITFNPVITYRNAIKTLARFGFSLGGTYPFSNGLLLSLSGGTEEIALRGLYMFSEKSGFYGLYELGYPVMGLAQPSHRVGMGWRAAPPPPVFPDLVINDIETTGKPLIDSVQTISLRLKNKGKREAADFPVYVG
jgi:hypothetical protein